MKTDEIVKLSRSAIAALIRSRQGNTEPFPGHERRKSARWPFPGTVEIRPVDSNVGPWFATCRNISDTGLGMSCEQFFELETPIEISIHLPEATLYGRAVVRYCQKTASGYMTGVEFDFSE